MSQLQVTGEAKIRDIQGPVVANSGVITALDGAASQYVRGDGTLADFPTSTGGGSSVSYYLNSSVSQGTIGGVAYRELSKEPIIGAGTDITISANGYVASYITDANDPDVLSVPGGNFNCEFYFSVNNNTGNPTTYAELYKYDGTTFTLLGSSQAVPESLNQGTTIAPYYFAIPVATAALALTDRLAIRIYVSVDGRVVTLHTENSHLCQVVTTFSKGMVSLNNLTDQSQFITTGTSGTNFNIVSSGDTHTFNLPVASATNTGKLSSTDWSTFNNKVPYTGATANVDLGIWDLDAASLFSNGLGVYIKKNVSGIANSVDYVALSSSTYKLNVAEASSATNAKIFNFDFSTLSDTTLSVNNTRTYTLPDSSGTLALTSNLSSYVPYTGATGSVDLGVYSLSADTLNGVGIFSVGSGTQSGFIGIKQGTTFLGNISGYNSINANATKFILTSDVGSTNYKSASFQLSSLTNNTERTYTLPDATGTIALTSNLSSYVPYTGATANVDLGSRDLTSRFIYLNGIGTTGGNLFLRKDIDPAFTLNYTTLYSTDNNIGFGSTDGTNTKKAIFSFGSLTNNTERTFTLPDITGTLALLEGTQTFSGAKTFTQSPISEGGYSFKILASGTLFGNGYSVISSLAGNVSISQAISAGNLKSFTFDFSAWATNTFYTYTLPALDGTLALLEGTQTFTGVKSFDTGILLKNGVVTTTSGYTGIGAGTSGINVSLGSGGGGLLIFQSTSYNYTFPAATGTIALTSNIPANIVTGTGTTNTLPKFTGTSTVGNSNITDTGSLITLGSNVTTTGSQFVQNGFYLTNANAGATAGYTHMWGADDGIFFGLRNATGGAKFVFQSATSYNYTFPAATGTLALTSQIPANPVGGTGTTNYLPKFTGTSTIGNSLVFDNGTNVGVNTATPNDYIDGESGMAILRATNGRAVLSLVGTRTDAGETLGRISFTNTNSTNAGAKRLAYISGTRGTTNNSAYLEFAVANDTLGAVAMTLSQTGNLGLGVTPSAWSIGKGFDINGGMGLLSVSNASFVLNNAYYNGGWIYKASSFAQNFLLNNDGSFQFNIAPSGTAGNAISFTQAMTLASTGNLLVGTTTDAGYKLDVNGTGRFSSNLNVFNGNAIVRNDTGSTYRGIVLGATTGDSSEYAYIKYQPNAGDLKIWGSPASFGGKTTFYNNDIQWLNVSSSNALTFTGAATFSSSVTANGLYANAGNSARFYRGANDYYWGVNNDSNNYLNFGTFAANGTAYGTNPKMILLDNGSIGIGTSSPGAKLSIAGTQGSTISSNVALLIGNSGAAASVGNLIQLGLHYNPDGATPASVIGAVLTSTAGFTKSDIFFATRDVTTDTAATEKMRITSGGDVLIGNSTISAAQSAIFLQKSGIITTVRSYSSGTINLVEFYKIGADIGTITYNGTNTLYNSTSDYRLKEDLKDFSALGIVSKLKTYNFKWKNTDVRDYGMMAHELQEILPNYVSGEKDAIREDGSIKSQNVDYSKIVPILVKAIQEEDAKVNAQELRIQQLESQIEELKALINK